MARVLRAARNRRRSTTRRPNVVGGVEKKNRWGGSPTETGDKRCFRCKKRKKETPEAPMQTHVKKRQQREGLTAKRGRNGRRNKVYQEGTKAASLVGRTEEKNDEGFLSGELESGRGDLVNIKQEEAGSSERIPSVARSF